MKEFEKAIRDYAAVGVPQIEEGGNGTIIIRWDMQPNIVDGKTEGVVSWAKWFDRFPTLGELVEAMIRVRYSISDELALLRQRDTKPEEFAEYNTFVEAAKVEAKTLLSINAAPAAEAPAQEEPAEGEQE